MAAAKQTRIVFGVGDIEAVRVVCANCDGEIARSVSHCSNKLPQRCPNCLMEWWDRVSTPNAVDATVGVLKALDRLRRVLSQDARPVTLRFEIDDPDRPA